MNLNRTLAQIDKQYPEKVLQFGTGVLLRGLPDYFIDKANKQGIFNGSIVVVKSTDAGGTDAFTTQEGCYTIAIRGIENGQYIDQNIVCSAISRVLSAKTAWNDILACAENSAMQIVISNTTEVGIQLVQEDIFASPPQSFPAKLLAFLYRRFCHFQGSKESGMVIVPTELIQDNGSRLEAIVFELAHLNGLATEFLDWLENANTFCNSLVDRIVPGKPDKETMTQLSQQLGYEDELLIVSEVFRLWAIEGDSHVKDVLSFCQADDGIHIEPNIDAFRELKLRLLNGTHTLSCGLAYLQGFDTVKEAMVSPEISTFISSLMLSELAPAIPYSMDEKKAQRFGQQVLDRFRNPYIEHHWLSITLNYTAKMKMRNIPTLLRYYEVFGQPPYYMAMGFAAYLLFMKGVTHNNGIYYGDRNGELYPIQDEKAAYFYEKWQSLEVEDLVTAVLSDTKLWDYDLTTLPKFAETVSQLVAQPQTL
jgi:tagaturonate reductase